MQLTPSCFFWTRLRPWQPDTVLADNADTGIMSRFVECWAKGNGKSANTHAKEIDTQLHVDRVSRNREKIIYSAWIDELPEGVFVELEGEPGIAWVFWNGELLRWQPEGYGKRRPKPFNSKVTVLTPKSTVNAIAAGYRPHVHHQK